MIFSFSSGLTLDLFVNQNEYIPSLSQEAGVRVLLTAERSIPFPVDEGFTVSPGFATSIGLRKVCVKLSRFAYIPYRHVSCACSNLNERTGAGQRYRE